MENNNLEKDILSFRMNEDSSDYKGALSVSGEREKEIMKTVHLFYNYSTPDFNFKHKDSVQGMNYILEKIKPKTIGELILTTSTLVAEVSTSIPS